MNKNTFPFILLAFVVVLSLLLSAKVYYEQYYWHNKALIYAEKEEKKLAVLYFTRVIDSHLPFSNVEKHSIEQLQEIARTYTLNGMLQDALFCYENIRSSRFLGYHLWLPDSDKVEEINQKIVELKLELLKSTGQTVDIESEYAKQMHFLKRDYLPNTAKVAVMSLFFWLSISCSVFLAYAKNKLTLSCSLITCLGFWIMLSQV